jgi:hypothetical protein
MEERMETKIGAEIKIIREKMDFNQEKMADEQQEMKAQVSSLAFRNETNRGEMTAKMDAWIEGKEA